MANKRIDTKDLFYLYDSIISDLLQAVSLFSKKEINTIPYTGSWTAGQVVEHITRSNDTIVQSLHINGYVTKRKPDERIPELKELFLDFTIKLESPDFILPTRDIYEKEVLVADLEKSVLQIREARNRINLIEALNHPAFGEITKLEIVHFALYHTQRHLHQLHKIYRALKG